MSKSINLYDLLNETASITGTEGGKLLPVGDGTLPENLTPLNTANPVGPLNPTNDVAQAAGAAYVNAELPFVPATLQDPINATSIDSLSIDSLVNNQIIPASASIQQDITNLAATVQNDFITFQVAQEGFGSYLQGILPDELATAAGAFSATMQQVKNVLSVDFEKFAQVAFAMETTRGLDLINGTDVPADIRLANEGYKLTALGSGPNGTYTMSDLFGCMSGLPYPWQNLYNGILDLQNVRLRNIYEELYLAVTWEKAYCTITVNPTYVNVQQYVPPSAGPPYDPGQPRIDNLYYTVTITVADIGGGYGRGGAPTPTVALSPNNCGATVTTSINTDPNTIDQGNYGRVTFTINNGSSFMYGTATNSSNNNPPNQVSGPYAPPVESIQVQAPPTATLAVLPNGSKATGGSNATGDIYYSVGSPSITVTGWPSPLNAVVSAYITQANDEIATIRTLYPLRAINLNSLHSVTGSQLTTEQRARFTGIAPVPQGIRDRFLNPYPSSLMVFVDSIPELARNTLPHMQVQTLEAISNLDLTAGQSIVGAMRESRNTARLDAIGVDQDNVILGELSPEQELALLVNGTTIATMPNNPFVPDVFNYPSVPESVFAVGFTNPALANNGNLIPEPLGTFNGSEILVTPESTPGDPNVLLPIINNPSLNIPPAIPNINAGSILLGPNPNTLGNYGPVPNPNLPVQYPSVGTLVPTGAGTPLDVGKAPLGSFAPSKAVNLLPPNLKFAAGTTLPSTFNVQEAIDKVIECNCDCWVQ